MGAVLYRLDSLLENGLAHIEFTSTICPTRQEGTHILPLAKKFIPQG